MALVGGGTQAWVERFLARPNCNSHTFSLTPLAQRLQHLPACLEGCAEVSCAAAVPFFCLLLLLLQLLLSLAMPNSHALSLIPCNTWCPPGL